MHSEQQYSKLMDCLRLSDTNSYALIKSLSVLDFEKRLFDIDGSLSKYRYLCDLEKLQHLQSLKLYLHNGLLSFPDDIPLNFWKFTFPKLQSLTLGHILLMSTETITFLNQQPMLNSLTIHCARESVNDLLLFANDMHIVLDNLKMYNGPSVLLAQILRDSPKIELETATIEWSTQSTAYLQILDIIAKSTSSKSCHTLMCQRISAPVQLISAIIQCLPNILHLSINSAKSGPVSAAVFKLPLEEMRALKSIRSLSFSGPILPDGTEEEHLEAISNSCPSITSLRFISTTGSEVAFWDRREEKQGFNWKLRPGIH